MDRCFVALAVLAAIIAAGAASAQTSSASCGDAVNVQRGDTLSRIAERCDVTERSIMRLNPRIEGSRDLRVGMQIRIRNDGGSGTGNTALDRLGSIAGETANSLAGLARDLGSSAQDILDKNPDLRQRLEGIGQRLSGASGGPNRAEPPVQGTITVTPAQAAAGASVEVSAQALPKDVAVVIGISAPEAAYEVIDRARTAPDGRLQRSIRVPDWASDLNRIVVVVASETGAWSARSAPVQITGGKL